MTQRGIAGFDGPARATPARCKKDGVVLRAPSGHGAEETRSSPSPYFTDNYWKQPGQSGAQRIRSGRAVRRAVRADAVPRRRSTVKAGTRRRDEGRAGGVPLRQGHLYFGDKRMELNVVPAFSVRVTPALAVVPAAPADARQARSTREIFVSVTNSTKGAAKATVALNVPAGWKVTPATAPIDFENEDESLSARFA